MKVSRSDYRRELAKPGKRARAVAVCHEFYLAVPAGLLKPEEAAWEPPPGFDASGRSPYTRTGCRGAWGFQCFDGRLVGLGRARRDDGRRIGRRAGGYDGVCPTCRGAGWLVESDAVRAGAPALWIPADVGLVEVRADGKVYVVRRAPLRREPTAIDGQALGSLARWISVRPDPRHGTLRK